MLFLEIKLRKLLILVDETEGKGKRSCEKKRLNYIINTSSPPMLISTNTLKGQNRGRGLEDTNPNEAKQFISSLIVLLTKLVLSS